MSNAFQYNHTGVVPKVTVDIVLLIGDGQFPIYCKYEVSKNGNFLSEASIKPPGTRSPFVLSHFNCGLLLALWSTDIVQLTQQAVTTPDLPESYAEKIKFIECFCCLAPGGYPAAKKNSHQDPYFKGGGNQLTQLHLEMTVKTMCSVRLRSYTD